MRSLPSIRTFVVLAGYVLGGFALYWGLPEQVPPSWTVSARRTVWLGTPMVAFLLPTAVAITDHLLRGLCVKHPIDEPNPVNILMISIGNLLPKTRPNLAIGIRTRLTLSDRALWIRVHRSVGHMVVACGAVLVLSAMTVPRPLGPTMILLVAPAALVGICLLVRFSRTQLHS